MLTQSDTADNSEALPRQTLLGRLGSLSTRLALNDKEINEAQRVRFRVFCEEYGAQSERSKIMAGIESDAHDDVCDHLLVLEKCENEAVRIIGTQRFFLFPAGNKNPNFYSQDEFDVASLVKRHNGLNFMELGRSCVLPDYRSKRTMELMWQGTWAYAVENQVDVMIGCASFHTRDVVEVSDQISFLSKIAGTEDDWSVEANSKNLVKIEPRDVELADTRRAFRRLPPLIKGYLRLGAMFSNHAVLDEEFGTIDVLVVLPVARISQRYINYYGEDASKHRDS